MKEPKPFYKKSHKRWYVQIDGVQYPLGPDKEGAWEEYHRLMAGRRQLGKDPPVLEIVQQFLTMSKRTHGGKTYDYYFLYNDLFLASLPKGLRLSGLKAHHLTDWVDSRWPLQDVIHRGEIVTQRASVNTREGAMRAVKRPFNWAADLEKITANPLKKVKLPKTTRREAYLMPEEYERLLPYIKDECFLDVVEVLRHTGCRPQEVRTMEARWFQRAMRFWEFPSKGVPLKCRNRVIHLDDTAMAITERLCLKHPEGPIFRNRKGVQWTHSALDQRCLRLSAKAKIKVTPYSFRHTFITDALYEGVDVVTLAKMVGHTDLRMINKVYEHIDKRSDHVRGQMLKAVGRLKSG